MTEPLDWRPGDFPYSIDVPTRWGDNDMLQHLNNVAYNRMIETVVVHFTLGPLEIDWRKDPIYPIVVESLCRFHRQLSFPEIIRVGLRAGGMGNSSVTYEIGMFGEDGDVPGATGHFIHVFIDKETQKSAPIPDHIRAKITEHGMQA